MYIEQSEEYGPLDGEESGQRVEFGPLEEDDLDEIFDGDSFNDREVMALSALVFSSEITDRCIGFLSEEVFSDDLQYSFRFVKKFYTDHGVPPDIQDVRMETKVCLFDLEGYPRYQRSIIEYLSSKLVEFARRKILEEGTMESIENFDDYSRSRSILQATFDHMDDVIAAHPDEDDLGDPNYFDELLAWTEENTNDPTGFEMLDEVISVTRPSVNMISASTGVGKSWFLLNQAVRYARLGHNVVVVSLELSKKEAETRLIQIITGRSLEQIKDDPDGAFHLLQRNFRKMGQIVIESLPMGQSTCSDVEARVKQIAKKRDIEVNYLIVDHLDHLEPSAGYKVGDIHDRDKKLTAELFNLAQRRDAIVWTASQQVKSAANEAFARADSLSDGADKANISANVIVLKKTDTTQTHQVLTGTIVKGRGGGTGMRVPFRFCTKTGKISTPEEFRPLFDEMNAPDDPDGKASKPKKTERDRVREKFDQKSPRRSAKAKVKEHLRETGSVH